jgi:hypothetical protein
MRTISLCAIACAIAACSSQGPGDGSTSYGPDASSGSHAAAGEGDATTGDDSPETADPSDSGDGGEVGDDGPATPLLDDGSCPANHSTQKSFVSQAVPVLSAFDPNQGDPIPGNGSDTPPSGWQFYDLSKTDHAICRDGSPMGIYVHYGSTKDLLVFFEGGGVCLSSHWCDHNPANIHQTFSADPQTQGETIGGSLAMQAVLQQPHPAGIFDLSRADNPFKDWSQVYIPYCTGDLHFGQVDDGQVYDWAGGQQGASPSNAMSMNPGYHFVGYSNTKAVIGHLRATFPGVQQALITGSSAGALAAVFSASMFQDTFGKDVHGAVLLDSAEGYPDTKYMPACFQEQVRKTFGLDQSLPADCAGCSNPDGSGLFKMIDYLHAKYPSEKLGLVSSIHDQIMRLFFSTGCAAGGCGAGMDNCDSNDPNILAGLGASFIGGNPPRYSPDLWSEALTTLRTGYDCTGAFSSYFIGTALPSASTEPADPIDTLHMHIFRDRFYMPMAGGMTLAQWAADLAAGKVEDIGP